MECGFLYASLTQPTTLTRATFALIPRTHASVNFSLLTIDFSAAGLVLSFEGKVRSDRRVRHRQVGGWKPVCLTDCLAFFQKPFLNGPIPGDDSVRRAFAP